MFRPGIGVSAVGALIVVLEIPAVYAIDDSFTRVIRSILARKCFACHGPDDVQGKADLRLDRRDVAIGPGAITPGDSSTSELIRQVYSDDAELPMPPRHPANLSVGGSWIRVPKGSHIERLLGLLLVMGSAGVFLMGFDRSYPA